MTCLAKERSHLCNYETARVVENCLSFITTRSVGIVSHANKKISIKFAHIWKNIRAPKFGKLAKGQGLNIRCSSVFAGQDGWRGDRLRGWRVIDIFQKRNKFYLNIRAESADIEHESVRSITAVDSKKGAVSDDHIQPTDTIHN